MYFYWQRSGESLWTAAKAEDRARIAAECKPAFVTVLDLSTELDGKETPEQLRAVKYFGPWYADIDSKSVEEGVAQFNKLLKKLQNRGVDLNQCRLYATGGRGFHVEVPMECFTKRATPIELLPQTYKEMAFALFVDCLDMRVYSAKRGRMWRVDGYNRADPGQPPIYKVRVLPEEMVGMDEARFRELCSRPTRSIQEDPPTLAPAMAELWTASRVKVRQVTKAAENNVKDQKILDAFSGDFPESLLQVMRGEVESPAGFNQIAMQIGAVTKALGKDHQEVLQLCKPLLEKHVSDGRYNNYNKRKHALLEQLRYMASNTSYSFSAGAVRKILPKGTEAPELRLGPDFSKGPVEMSIEQEEGQPQGSTESGTTITYDRLCNMIKVKAGGLFAVTAGEDGRQLSNGRMASCKPLLNQHGLLESYECSYVVDGHRTLTIEVPAEAFLSAKAYAKILIKHSIVWSANDQQTTAYARVHQLNAAKEVASYLHHREGLDLVQCPTDKSRWETIWLSNEGVLHAAGAENPTQYRLHGKINMDGVFRSDLHTAGDVAGNENRLFTMLKGFTELNDPAVIGNLLGWSVSCFFRPFYHKAFQQFPLLMVYGEAGSGKSTTMRLLSRIFYNHNRPFTQQAASTTNHAFHGALVSSSSIPLFLDEYKPRQLPNGRHDAYLNAFRAAYGAEGQSKGGYEGEWRAINMLPFTSPILIIAEAVESETATLERTITVALAKHSNNRSRAALETVQDNEDMLSVLGRALMQVALNTDIDEFKSSVRADVATMRSNPRLRDTPERITFNMAVALNGISLLWDAVQSWFSPSQVAALSSAFEAMRAGVCDPSNQVAIGTMSEASKTLHAMALMTNMGDEHQHSDTALQEGLDYCYSAIGNGEFLDLRVRNVYAKYAAWCRRFNTTPLYDTETAFLQAMQKYQPLVTTAPGDSALKTIDPSATVYRFRVSLLREEGVDPFKKST